MQQLVEKLTDMKQDFALLRSSISDPHIKKTIEIYAKSTGKTIAVATGELQDLIDLRISKIDKSVINKNAIENVAESAIFKMMSALDPSDIDLSQFGVEAEDLLDRDDFFDLTQFVLGENAQFFPLRNPFEKKAVKPFFYITPDHLPSIQDPQLRQSAEFSCATAFCTPLAEMVFNRKFTEQLAISALIKGVKPKSAKYKSNGGPIPDHYCYLEFVIMHELLHFSAGDHFYTKPMIEKITKKYPKVGNRAHQILNYVGDYINNWTLVKSGYEQLPIGLFSEDVNYDKYDTYEEIIDAVVEELIDLSDDDFDEMSKEMEKDMDEHMDNPDDTPSQGGAESEPQEKSSENQQQQEPSQNDQETDKEPSQNDQEPQDGDGDGEGEPQDGDSEPQDGEPQDGEDGEGEGEPQDGEDGEDGQGSGQDGEPQDGEDGEDGQGSGQDGEPQDGEDGEDGQGSGEDGSGQDGEPQAGEPQDGEGEGEHQDGEPPAGEGQDGQGRDGQGQDSADDLAKAIDDANKKNQENVDNRDDGNNDAESALESKDDDISDQDLENKVSKASSKIEFKTEKTTINWKKILKKMIPKGDGDVEDTYSKMSRQATSSMVTAQQTGAGRISPGEITIDSEKKGLVFIIDNSGSVMTEVNKFNQEIIQLLKKNKKFLENMYVIKFSSGFEVNKVDVKTMKYREIKNTVEFNQKKPKFKYGPSKGIKELFTETYGLGTEYSPEMHRVIEKLHDDNMNVIMFTDDDLVYDTNASKFFKLGKKRKNSIAMFLTDKRSHTNMVNKFGNFKFMTVIK